MLKKIESLVKDKHHKRYVIAVSIFLVIVCILVFLRIQAAIALKNKTQADAITVVSVITAKQVLGSEKMVLPGNVVAWHEAPIYARTNGYIKKWFVDIGSHVTTGELLAEIEAPEVEAQARQAAADVNTAIANNNLAQSSALRWANLLKTNSVSKQEADERKSSALALEAAMIAAKANLDRLNQLVSFERVVAPFDGVITARATDIGALINAGSSPTGMPLFRISQTSPLRIYVKIPQSYASRLQPGMKVKLHFAEHPNTDFSAILSTTAKAIDPDSRTLLAQFTTQNKDGKLLPGGYTQVEFSFPIPSHTVRLPINTLLFRAEGLQVATVDKDNKIVLKPITINRDFGIEVEVVTGINAGDSVVVNPSDSIANGDLVRIAS